MPMTCSDSKQNLDLNSGMTTESPCPKEGLNTTEDCIPIDEPNSIEYNTNEDSNSKTDLKSNKYSNTKEDHLNPKEDQSSNHTNRWSLQEHPNKGTQVRNSPSLGSIPKHKRASKSSKDELSDLPETWDEECQKHLVDFAER